MLSFGAGYITTDLGKTMQGAPVKSEGEDGLPVPPYAIYTIDIRTGLRAFAEWYGEYYGKYYGKCI